MKDSTSPYSVMDIYKFIIIKMGDSPAAEERNKHYLGYRKQKNQG